jgi:hypothetical protein
LLRVLKRDLEAAQAAADSQRGPGQILGPSGRASLAGCFQQHLPGRGQVAAHLQGFAVLDCHGDRLV